MSELKYYTFVYTAALVLLLAFNGRTFSQIDVFEDREELYYEVYYSFINAYKNVE